MILEVSAENLRDIAAAVHAARKREPSAVLDEVEALVLRGISLREDAIELGTAQAQVLREALLKRAWAQRSNSEGMDYADLAERIERALDDDIPPLDD